jgi:predicted nucleic acid-binding protein
MGRGDMGSDTFDEEDARVYGRLFAAARAAGQSSRSRLVDLLIASTTAANSLPLYTRNPDDFKALNGIVKVIAI